MCFRVLRPALILLVAGLFAVPAPAATAPEDLLPDDTLAFVTAPDFASIRSLLTNAPQTAYWRDPAMQAFRDHFSDSTETNFVQPIQSLLGFDPFPLADLFQGQATLALLQNGWDGTSNSRPALVLVADVGGATNKLAKKLKFVAKEWTDQGRSFQTNLVHGLPFLSWSANEPDLRKFIGPSAPKSAVDTNASRLSFAFGQSGSLLLLSTSMTGVERIVGLQAGDGSKPIAAHPEILGPRTQLFAGAAVYAWADPTRILPPLLRMVSSRETVFSPDTLVRFFGLSSLKSAALAVHCDIVGTRIDVSVASPVGARSGLLKFSGIKRDESGPPPIIPESVLGVSRFRIDLKALLTGVEKFVVDAEPAASGAIELIAGTAGKDEDPDYDLRHGLLDNLGTDVVVYQPLPVGNTVEDLLLPTKVVLIASPASGRLANAVRVLAETLSPERDSVTNRMFAGTRIYHLKSFGGDEEGGGIGFAAVPGYVAFSSDESLIEALLQSTQTKAPSLADHPGIKQAADIVGGWNTGWFTYQNERAKLRLELAGVKRLVDDPVDLTLLGRLLLLLNSGDSDRLPLFDYKLHPPFDGVAKYLGFSVATGQMTDEGYRFRVFTPAPPASALVAPAQVAVPPPSPAPISAPAQPVVPAPTASAPSVPAPTAPQK
jgi:hypothetical protein